MNNIRLTVNHNRCVGSQLCMQFSPKVFQLNENGQSSVIDADAESLEQILATAEQCPQVAIMVEDLATGVQLFPPPELGL